MTGKIKKILSALFYPIVILCLALAIWQVLAAVAGSEFLFPSLPTTLSAFIKMLTLPSTYEALLGTLFRTLLSFIISVVVALALAILSALFSPLKKLLTPIVSACRALPTMAITLVLSIWVGAKTAPVIVSLMVILPTAYATFCEGINAIDNDILDMAKIDGAKNTTIAFSFILPLCLTFSKRSTSANLSLNLKLMVAAETLAGTAHSIGHSMMLSSIYIETAMLMALTVLTVFVSIILEWLLYLLLSAFFRD